MADLTKIREAAIACYRTFWLYGIDGKPVVIRRYLKRETKGAAPIYVEENAGELTPDNAAIGADAYLELKRAWSQWMDWAGDMKP